MKQDSKLDVKWIDELLEGRSTVESIAGENGLFKQLTRRFWSARWPPS